MKKKSIFFLLMSVLLLTVVFSVIAEGDQETITSKAGNELQNVKLTVMDFIAEDLSTAEIQLVTDYIALISETAPGCSLLDRYNRRYILEDLSFPDPDCTDSPAQLSAAKQLSIDYFIGGSLQNNGNYKITINLIDAKKGRTIRSESGTYPDLDGLLKGCEPLVGKLMNKNTAAGTNSASSGARAASTPSRPRITGSGYKYTFRGLKYQWAYDEFPLLADKIVSEIPESMEAKLLKDEVYNAVGIRTSLVIGGGLATLGSMALWLPPLIEDEDSPLLWVGAGIGVTGYIMLLVGLLDEGDVPVMAELVKLYNSNLHK